MLLKLILSPADLQYFLESRHFSRVWTFLEEVNRVLIEESEVVATAAAATAATASPTLPVGYQRVLTLLDQCQDALTLFPREDSASSGTSSLDAQSRFGSKQFRAYFDHIHRHLAEWTAEWWWPNALVRQDSLEYFRNCFGNRQRLDYGTGHELNFFLCLYLWERGGVLGGEPSGDGGGAPSAGDDDASRRPHSAITRNLLRRYIEWMRAVQMQYWLEPAGSHGVWGLDDYQFLPFLFGAAELVKHPYLRPKAIHESEWLDSLAQQYMYFSCIHFINQCKTSASLAWHSPLLNDISGVKTWAKVNSGLVKMYRHEVWDKLPIMQHFLFGRCIGCVGWESWSDEERRHWLDMFSEDGVDEQEQDVEFLPPSCADRGHYRIFFDDGTSTLGDENTQPTNTSTIEDEEVEEIIVKFVTGPSGNKIPIKGRIASSHATQLAQHQPNCHVANQPLALDTFALGQERPNCCGIRVPSAIAAKMYESQRKKLPFD